MSRDPGNVDERTKPCNRLHIEQIKSAEDKDLVLKLFTVDELKEELAYRRTLDRAKKHLPSAQAALERAQAKVEAYRKALSHDASVRDHKVYRASYHHLNCVGFNCKGGQHCIGRKS